VLVVGATVGVTVVVGTSVGVIVVVGVTVSDDQYTSYVGPEFTPADVNVIISTAIMI